MLLKRRHLFSNNFKYYHHICIYCFNQVFITMRPTAAAFKEAAKQIGPSGYQVRLIHDLKRVPLMSVLFIAYLGWPMAVGYANSKGLFYVS